MEFCTQNKCALKIFTITLAAGDDVENVKRNRTLIKHQRHWSINLTFTRLSTSISFLCAALISVWLDSLNIKIGKISKILWSIRLNFWIYDVWSSVNGNSRDSGIGISDRVQWQNIVGRRFCDWHMNWPPAVALVHVASEFPESYCPPRCSIENIHYPSTEKRR